MGIDRIRPLIGRAVTVSDQGAILAEGVLQHARQERATYRPVPGSGTWSGDVLVLVVGDKTLEVSTSINVEAGTHKTLRSRHPSRAQE